jgi:hypothetical protein
LASPGADQPDQASSVKAFIFSEVTRNTGAPEDFLTNGSKYEIVKSQGETGASPGSQIA